MSFTVKKLARILVLFISILILLGVSLRGVLARYYFKIESEKLYKHYGILVTYNTLEFKGLRTIAFDNLSIKTSSDTLMQFGKIETTLSITNLFAFKVNPLYVNLSNSKINLHSLIRYKEQNAQNINASKIIEHQSNNGIPIIRLNKLIKNFFGLSTAHFNVDNLNINFKDSAYSGTINILNWEHKGNQFTANASLSDNFGNQTFNILGSTNKKQNKLVISLQGEKDNKVKIPFLEPFINTTAQFNSATLELQAKELKKDKIRLNINCSANNLQLNGKRIAESVVEIDSCSSNIDFIITPDTYCIDSLSTIKLNKIEANIGSCYSMNDSALNIQFKSTKNLWQDLVESLPKGLFNNLDGIHLNGEFQYNLCINLKLSNPDSLVIDPNLISKGFYIQSYGNTNFTSLNDTFTHKVYNEGAYVRSIHLGSSNKNFTTIENISPFIKWAVITSEDGGFYNHNGFDLDGIRYAMACNIKEKRFARGGSTISQQLVKNLYLSRNKNITRKFEELLIVWMIEHNSIVSKDRMLEIYFNIIEWGPNVYGVKEACKYYFNKKPNEISLQEALFLAYIVPRPTKFKWFFEDENHLKPFMINNFEFVSNKMLNRGYITDDDYNSILNIGEFKLNGEAKNVIAKQDTFPSDTIEIIDFTEE